MWNSKFLKKYVYFSFLPYFHCNQHNTTDTAGLSHLTNILGDSKESRNTHKGQAFLFHVQTVYKL